MREIDHPVQGYNDRSGSAHCEDVGCVVEGATLSTGHAEANAIIQGPQRVSIGGRIYTIEAPAGHASVIANDVEPRLYGEFYRDESLSPSRGNRIAGDLGGIDQPVALSYQQPVATLK